MILYLYGESLILIKTLHQIGIVIDFTAKIITTINYFR